jgi:hypothetical protein
MPYQTPSASQYVQMLRIKSGLETTQARTNLKPGAVPLTSGGYYAGFPGIIRLPCNYLQSNKFPIANCSVSEAPAPPPGPIIDESQIVDMQLDGWFDPIPGDGSIFVSLQPGNPYLEKDPFGIAFNVEISNLTNAIDYITKIEFTYDNAISVNSVSSITSTISGTLNVTNSGSANVFRLLFSPNTLSARGIVTFNILLNIPRSIIGIVLYGS